MSKQTKVKIVKSEDPDNWYANRIGETFIVKDYEDGDYTLVKKEFERERALLTEQERIGLVALCISYQDCEIAV